MENQKESLAPLRVTMTRIYAHGVVAIERFFIGSAPGSNSPSNGSTTQPTGLERQSQNGRFFPSLIPWIALRGGSHYV